MEKNILRIRMKAKGAYLGDSMFILAPCFIAFLRWGLKALCFKYFFEGRGEFLRFDNFLEETDCQGWMGEI